MHDLKKVLGILNQGLNNEQQPKIYYRPEFYTHQKREDYLYSSAFFDEVKHEPATRDTVTDIIENAHKILRNQNSTALQKNIANYILKQNEYALKHQNKFGYKALFSLRSIAWNNYDNELAKRKLSIAHYALDPKFNDHERKLIIENSCQSAREYTGSLLVGFGAAFFAKKPPGHLEAAVQEKPALTMQRR